MHIEHGCMHVCAHTQTACMHVHMHSKRQPTLLLPMLSVGQRTCTTWLDQEASGPGMVKKSLFSGNGRRTTNSNAGDRASVLASTIPASKWNPLNSSKSHPFPQSFKINFYLNLTKHFTANSHCLVHIMFRQIQVSSNSDILPPIHTVSCGKETCLHDMHANRFPCRMHSRHSRRVVACTRGLEWS